MAWLEYSKDPLHGGPGWGFGQCLWAPRFRTSKNGKQSRWPYWDAIQRIRPGDRVYHIRHEDGENRFVAQSFASSVPYFTNDEPPSPSEWAGAGEYQRIDLRDYEEFSAAVDVDAWFARNDAFLRERRKREDVGVPVFYEVNRGQLRVTMGAYCTILEKDLEALLVSNPTLAEPRGADADSSIATGERKSVVLARIGQHEWRTALLDKHGSSCWFPGCHVSTPELLTASHIARWRDNPERRGRLDNGMLLCKNHDAAFEQGFFTIDRSMSVRLHPYAHAGLNPPDLAWLISGNRQRLQTDSQVALESLQAHWRRCGYEPG